MGKYTPFLFIYRTMKVARYSNVLDFIKEHDLAPREILVLSETMGAPKIPKNLLNAWRGEGLQVHSGPITQEQLDEYRAIGAIFVVTTMRIDYKLRNDTYVKYMGTPIKSYYPKKDGSLDEKIHNYIIAFHTVPKHTDYSDFNTGLFHVLHEKSQQKQHI